MTTDGARAWMDERHPDWREWGTTMGLLSMRSGEAWPHSPKNLELALDDLYHVVTNAPGCALCNVR